MPQLLLSPELRARTRDVAVATLVAALSLFALPAPRAHALDPNETNAAKIAKAVQDRYDGDKSTSKVSLTLIDSSGRKRVRKTRQMTMEFEGGTKSLMFFESPADVRNTGLLSIDYDDGAKDDDQWLYLPSLHKSTRISTSDKSGSFMGTDITYSDMTKKDTKVYDYKIVEQSVKVDGDDCWLIEARPKTEKEKKETGYLKTHTWISKSKLMPLQVKAWVIEGKKLKYIKFSNFKQLQAEKGKVWVAQRMEVRTMRNKNVESTTLLVTDGTKFGDPTVTEDQFSERRLEKGL